MKQIINKYLIAYLTDKVIMTDTQVTRNNSVIINLLQQELAVLGGELICPDNLPYISDEDAAETIKVLNVFYSDRKLPQPNFPESLVVLPELRLDPVEYREKLFNYVLDFKRRSISRDYGITEDELIEMIREKSKKNKIEFLWLIQEHLIEEKPREILYRFYSENKEKSRVKSIPRAKRRELLGELERTIEGYHMVPSDRTLWLRFSEVLHPGEYKTRYPKSCKFFEFVKKNPERSKKSTSEDFVARFPKRLEKAWKKGNEFVIFDELYEKDLTPLELIRLLKILETRHSVGRRKIFEREPKKFVVYGKRPTEEDAEILETFRHIIKERLVSEMKGKYYCPLFSKLPVTELLTPDWNKKETIKSGSRYTVRLVSTRPNEMTNSRLSAYSEWGLGIAEKSWGVLELEPKMTEYKKIVVYISSFSTSLVSKPLSMSDSMCIVEDSAGKPLLVKLLKHSVSSIIGLIYTPETNTISWVGESSKSYYAGQPHMIKHHEEVIADWDNPKRLMIGDISDERGKEININSLKKELGI